MIYSAGWLAGFGVIKGLIRSSDFVVMDMLSHNCLQEGARAATPNVIKTGHLDVAEMEEKMAELRAKHPNAGIMAVTEGLFSMDSDSPDLKRLQKAAKKNGCTLVIDCAHDFGSMGKNGRGIWEEQGLEDFSNVILVGTGSKTLSTNIGFVGCNDPNVIEFLKVASSAYLFTNAINPVQAATSLANLRILSSEEGRIRRAKVIENYHYLREKLEATGNRIFGQACPILPLFVGNEMNSRMVARLMMDRGFHVNGIEFPVVMLGQARLRVNLMPQHTREQMDSFVETFNEVKEEAERIVQESIKHYDSLKKGEARL